MIKVIFFDAAGTLFHLPRGVGWHYRGVAERHGCRLDGDSLQQAFKVAWKEMPARTSDRRPRTDDDKDWWRALVGRVLDRCEVAASQLDRKAYFEELYREFTLPETWELFPEVHEVLNALRPQFRLGVISNFDRRLRRILQNLDLVECFDPLILSSEVGADKPDAWIFQRALESANVAANEALHVGDDPICDWQGAAAAGLEVFRLERPSTSLRVLLDRFTAPSAS